MSCHILSFCLSQLLDLRFVPPAENSPKAENERDPWRFVKSLNLKPLSLLKKIQFCFTSSGYYVNTVCNKCVCLPCRRCVRSRTKRPNIKSSRAVHQSRASAWDQQINAWQRKTMMIRQAQTTREIIIQTRMQTRMHASKMQPRRRVCDGSRLEETRSLKTRYKGRRKLRRVARSAKMKRETKRKTKAQSRRRESGRDPH